LLQSGRFNADLCYFYGEDAPNDLPYRNGLSPKLPGGYDYDGCDATTVMKMTVKDGRIGLPSGMTYRVLVLPERPTITPALLRKVRGLVAAGATVVGPKPHGSPSLADFPRCDDEVRQIAAELWGDVDGAGVKE